MDFSIREAQPNDIDTIHSLILTLATFEGKQDFVTNTSSLMKKEADFFKAFVAENNQKILVGIIIYYFDYSTYVGKSMHIEDIIVLEEYRGVQIGTKLMERVIEAAKREDCKRIRWQVLRSNKMAKAFYKKFGANIDENYSICSIDL